MTRLRDASLDLLLGGRCVGCTRPGRILCDGCRGLLPTGADVHRPGPVPPGSAPTFAVTAYDGLVRELVIGHKEHRLLALRPVLGALLADAVRAAVAGASGPVLLVPVPSRPASVRERGHDPTLTMTADAARRVASGRRGPVTALPLLRTRPGVRDQAGLDAAGRRANLAGSMAVGTARLRAAARRHPAAHVVVCDDVLTTGSTVREAQRALEAVGVRVLAVAAVAATPRRPRPVTTGPAHFPDDLQAGRLSQPPGTH